MADTFAGKYSPEFFNRFTTLVSSSCASFNSDEFLQFIYDQEWEQKAFKQRIRHISHALRATLPTSYREALSVLFSIAPQCTGVEYLFFPDFVEAYGQDDWEASIPALERFTPYSSSEFAVRPFIVQDQARMMDQMLRWAAHEDPHVRRLASEGCRPRLPWAMALEAFKADPAPIFPILEALKQDESVYVQKSVANNLNDIAKDHPALVKQLVRDWFGVNKHTDWIVKHGSRTLLRAADPEMLSLFGFETSPDVTVRELKLGTSSIEIGETLPFSFSILSRASEAQQLRIEYAIDFVKANGKTSRKRFKISEYTLEQGNKAYVRNHSFKDLTTRKHYPGKHRLAVIINGVELAAADFDVHAAAYTTRS